jgi:hypothetical protein
MRNMSRNRKGVAPLVILLIVLAVIAVIGLGILGFKAYQSYKKNQMTENPEFSAASDCNCYLKLENAVYQPNTSVLRYNAGTIFYFSEGDVVCSSDKGRPGIEGDVDKKRELYECKGNGGWTLLTGVTKGDYGCMENTESWFAVEKGFGANCCCNGDNCYVKSATLGCADKVGFTEVSCDTVPEEAVYKVLDGTSDMSTESTLADGGKSVAGEAKPSPVCDIAGYFSSFGIDATCRSNIDAQRDALNAKYGYTLSRTSVTELNTLILKSRSSGDADADLDGESLVNADECAAYVSATGTDPLRPDTDLDGVNDNTDNCKDVANGPSKGTCVIEGRVGDPCDGDDGCPGGTCQKNQENSDSASLNPDGFGDVCDDDIDGDGLDNDDDFAPGDATVQLASDVEEQSYCFTDRSSDGVNMVYFAEDKVGVVNKLRIGDTVCSRDRKTIYKCTAENTVVNEKVCEPNTRCGGSPSLDPGLQPKCQNYCDVSEYTSISQYGELDTVYLSELAAMRGTADRIPTPDDKDVMMPLMFVGETACTTENKVVLCHEGEVKYDEESGEYLEFGKAEIPGQGDWNKPYFGNCDYKGDDIDYNMVCDYNPSDGRADCVPEELKIARSDNVGEFSKIDEANPVDYRRKLYFQRLLRNLWEREAESKAYIDGFNVGGKTWEDIRTVEYASFHVRHSPYFCTVGVDWLSQYESPIYGESGYGAEISPEVAQLSKAELVAATGVPPEGDFTGVTVVLAGQYVCGKDAAGKTAVFRCEYDYAGKAADSREVPTKFVLQPRTAEYSGITYEITGCTLPTYTTVDGRTVNAPSLDWVSMYTWSEDSPFDEWMMRLDWAKVE